MVAQVYFTVSPDKNVPMAVAVAEIFNMAEHCLADRVVLAALA